MKTHYLSISSLAVPLMVLALLPAFIAFGQNDHGTGNWCNKPLRAGLEKLKEIKTSRPWFKVYDAGNNTYAIDEPYNWEETIAYLIIGKNEALLFDSGMGLDSISLVIKQLTQLPVLVINSHTHNDHIGGNSEFTHVIGMNTAYTRLHAANGYPHSDVKDEVNPSSFCLQRLPGTDTAKYCIKPFKVDTYVTGGYTIALGQRNIQVVATPGHAPDAICLYDEQAGYLWCGDSFYEGPIFLFSDSTDIRAYHKSINTIARLAARCKYVLPAHNLPLAKPELVIKAAADFNDIAAGKKKGQLQADGTLLYDCGKFAYQIGSTFVQQLLAGAK